MPAGPAIAMGIAIDNERKKRLNRIIDRAGPKAFDRLDGEALDRLKKAG